MTAAHYKLLAADDDPTVGLLLRAALPAHGFSVTIVVNGLDALEQALGGDFDIFLLDVEMPGLDGLSVSQEIRRSLPRDVPIVLATGRADAAFCDRLAALQAKHLPKPIDWSSLGPYLRSLLGAAA